jgi:hypothetical protein
MNITTHHIDIQYLFYHFTIVIAAVSAFFNNTPIVAMMIPAVIHWTRKNQQPASQYLIPLSYATIMGGTCTLIGTSTNLVVHGMGALKWWSRLIRPWPVRPSGKVISEAPMMPSFWQFTAVGNGFGKKSATLSFGRAIPC